MSAKHKLLRGTIILTAAGLLSRLMGFFFRIFLSHAFGEENVGLYQLIFPVYSLCLALGTSGIQTALSRTVARNASLGRDSEARNALSIALTLTGAFSVIEIFFIQSHAGMIASRFLGDPRCEELLLIISYALPCAAVHSCICGYSYGMQQTRLPALSQLIEQTARIFSVLLLFYIFRQNGSTPSVSLATSGIVIGEFASALFSIRFIPKRKRSVVRSHLRTVRKTGRELITLSLPLTASRACVTLLQSIEAASIPAMLKLYSHSASEALILYGVLTGMALPCILFPSAITSSVGVMLMPAVAEKQAEGSRSGISSLIRKAAGSCFILGLACCLFFLIFGSYIGKLLFHSETAGKFIVTLAWICPFLYTNSALMSTINGLGKTLWTFLINVLGLTVRIISVFLAIPVFGMQGYLWGLLISQLAVTLLSCTVLKLTAPIPQETEKSPQKTAG